jgi:hypothetical protein
MILISYSEPDKDPSKQAHAGRIFTEAERKRVRETDKCLVCWKTHKFYLFCPSCISGGVCRDQFEKQLQANSQCHTCKTVITVDELLDSRNIIGDVPDWTDT